MLDRFRTQFHLGVRKLQNFPVLKHTKASIDE